MNHQTYPIPKASRAPKFKVPEEKGFTAELKERVNAYFEKTGKQRRGGLAISLKIFFVLGFSAMSYFMMLYHPFAPFFTLVFAVLFGISQVLIVFCIAHDAAHHALFDSPWLNKVFSYSFNLVGANAYMWNITHNQIHHTYPNVADYDTDIHQQAPLIRVSPSVPLKRYHRYQPYYAPILYLFYSIFLVFQKDIQDIGLLPKKDSLLLRNKKHPRSEYMVFIASKLVYITYTIIIPYIILDISLIWFLAGYLIVHFMMSLFLSLVLIPVHMVDEAAFASVDDDLTISDNWVMHVMKNTVDYSRKSKWANFFFGGLNTHLVHHIFPGICHIHYIAMSDILRQTALDFGLAYHEVTMKEAICSHFRLLKRMSLA